MKRKYGIGLFVVMITICAFVATAFSQPCNPTTECPCDPTSSSNCGDLDDTTNGCKECTKCPIGNIPCPGETQGPQGTVISDNVNPFDYDGEAYPADADYANPVGFGSYGYDTNFNYAQDNFRDCKFIMDVCRCPQACDILPGSKVAIQVIIKTKGVYFAGRANGGELNRIRFDLRGEEINLPGELCAKQANGQPDRREMGNGRYFFDASNNAVAYQNMAATTVDQVRHFPDVKYYRQYREYYDGSGKFISEVYEDTVSGVPVSPLGGAQSNALAEVNKVVALESQGEYMFNDFDAGIVGDNKECHIWVDIPPMRINPGEYTTGDKVRVVVRLVFNREQPGICPTCHPPDYCECERDIAIICSGQGAIAGQGCMYFPYALFNAPGGWSTGLAITKNDDTVSVAKMEATLTLTDQADNKFTYKKTDFTTPVWAFVLDSIMGSFTPVTPGTTPMGPAGSLKVDGNFSMDGYNFMNAGEFGCGTMPRGCCGNAACGP